ncbi:phosphogluconate dehydrogenase (NAD(+)-dependent, decarboxylating) [uncultured Ilyobacter sp.]|jgi:6-phosphogluconate dehydrogenase|uniref:phosphogluconate dehydrogenase (NAD(+)-dependent, decarboxylating) n=1 Tax=uncultured Ilyobacter sp. TaxID=544433 RepID=UPI002AA6291D|nr:decarboxylating 6-phosphogluconate dehydrogenase [uncultured Ilyobacter sp.]
MKIAMIGLGKMGGNMAKKLIEKRHEVTVYDINSELRKKYKAIGAKAVESIEELCKEAGKGNIEIMWFMLPAGEITENTILDISMRCTESKVIVDGGNSFYKNTMKLEEKISKNGHTLMDAGTSGGIWGFERGYCFMIGGDKRSYDFIKPVLEDLSKPEGGYEYMGPAGSGHFVKMVHNGIEYAMMEAFGEGFEILKEKKEFDLNLEKISKVWQHGSVIDSWLLELCGDLFEKEGNLEGIKGYVEDSGEGRWTVMESIEERVAAPVITLSLLQRFRSRKDETFSDKVIAGLRNQFGGHSVKTKKGG